MSAPPGCRRVAVGQRESGRGHPGSERPPRTAEGSTFSRLAGKVWVPPGGGGGEDGCQGDQEGPQLTQIKQLVERATLAMALDRCRASARPRHRRSSFHLLLGPCARSVTSSRPGRPPPLPGAAAGPAARPSWAVGPGRASAHTWPGYALLLLSAGTSRARPGGGRSGTEERGAGGRGQDQSKDQPEDPGQLGQRWPWR